MTLDEAAELLVAPEVLDVYPMAELDRATEIWCEGTDGVFCPTLIVAAPGEKADIAMIEACGDNDNALACFWPDSRQITLRDRVSPECVGSIVAHELGHAIKLRFGADTEDPRHAMNSASLMHSHKLDAACDPDWALDHATYAAFEAKYGHVIAATVGIGP